MAAVNGIARIKNGTLTRAANVANAITPVSKANIFSIRNNFIIHLINTTGPNADVNTINLANILKILNK